MSKYYARMLAMLALIDREPALHSRKELAERYGISAWMVTKTFRTAKTEFDVKVSVVGFGKDQKYKLIEWGAFKGSWVLQKQAHHESILTDGGLSSTSE